jgi:hypothetical protein
MDVIAKGVVATLLDPAETIVTVLYSGPPAVTVGLAGPTTGWNDLDPDQFWPTTQPPTHTGPFSIAFFTGMAGIIDHIAPNVTMTDFFAPTGTGGTGQLTAGGVLLSPTTLYDNMKAEAESEDIMVVNVNTHLGGDSGGTIADPTTGAPLGEGDLFVQADVFLTLLSTALPAHLLNATNSAIITIGAIIPLAPPLVNVPTVTTILT